MNEGILNRRERVSSSHKWAIYLLVDIDHWLDHTKPALISADMIIRRRIR